MNSFQLESLLWAINTFGIETATNKEERNLRFLEESLELVQSLGMSEEKVRALVDYIFDRPLGEPKQEVGGVLVTLALLCSSNGIQMQEVGYEELDRIVENSSKIGEKWKSKPTHIRYQKKTD